MTDGINSGEGVSTVLRALLDAKEALRAAHHALGRRWRPWPQRVHPRACSRGAVHPRVRGEQIPD
ncbi:hypothetical protein GCM10010274_57700 [Streptomyces lavendofoliae]|uniref:Uncharacterized protein n=1 Tax=Streptomyces lavendofoliae TaxID=67314 RepID=A0A918M7F5_9ACTN|nr:hypothetical protein GCM10010274_57700 [Streptomyces lavendofoliae]